MKYVTGLLLAVMIASSTTGCAAIVIGAAIAISDANAKRERAARDELEALRANAGLTHEQFMQEMREYDPRWYRTEERKRISAEVRKGQPKLPPHMASQPWVANMPTAARAEWEALPDARTTWGLDQLLYRARRLLVNASEAEILTELAAKYPKWWKKREAHESKARD